MSAGPQLPGIFHALEPVLAHYGYLAVGGLVLLEDFGVPVPGETVLIAAAVYAGAGRLNVVAVAVVAFVAAVVGDNIGYAIGHFGGRELALRWGRYVFLTPRRLNHAEEFFRRHGGKIVTVARFIEGLRQVNGIIAGIAKMRWLSRFLPFETLGAALWVGLWVAVGYTAGSNLNVLYQQIGRYEVYFGVGIAAAFVAYIGYRVRAHYRTRHAEKEAAAEPDDVRAEDARSDEDASHENRSASPAADMGPVEAASRSGSEQFWRSTGDRVADSVTAMDSTVHRTFLPTSGVNMTDSSTQGIKTVLHPVSDLATAKAVYTALLGVPPQADESYYVGFEAAGQHIGLVPGGGQKMTSPVAYWHVPDIEAKLAEVTAAGAAVKEPVRDVGGGRLVATVTDPDGNVLGLLQDR